MSDGHDYPDPWGPDGKFIESGPERVCDIHLEGDACAPDCSFCNGVDEAKCFCGPGCEGKQADPPE